jgi:hypothetical protein
MAFRPILNPKRTPGITRKIKDQIPKWLRMNYGPLQLPKDYANALLEFQLSNIPKERGKFDPYKIFPVGNPWEKYIGIPDEYLNFWQKLDKRYILYRRSRQHYHKLGLLSDDMWDAEEPVVIEATNRLPKPLFEARAYRIMRAQDYSGHGITLPEDQWTKWEDDVAYLVPYLLWVEREMSEVDMEYQTREQFDLKFQPKNRLQEYEHGRIYRFRQVD